LKPFLCLQCPAIPTTTNIPKQVIELESEFKTCVKELKRWNRIVGILLILEEMLNPMEKVISQPPNELDISDKAIVAQVKHDLVVERGKILEVESDDSNKEETEEKEPTTAEMINICWEMEDLCLKYGSPETSLGLSKQLHQFHIHLRQEVDRKMK